MRGRKGEGPMQNVEFEIEGDQLVIRVDLSQELGVSSSGKSVIVATTGGNVAVAGGVAGKAGVKVYRPHQAGRTSRRMASQGEEGEEMSKGRGIWAVFPIVIALVLLYSYS